VIVLNAAPVLHNLFVTSPVEESGVASLTAAIGDEGVLDSFSILVDWGDGSPQEIYNYPAGATAILETHSYLDDDPSGTGSDAYEVTVTIEDDDTGVDTAALPIEVVNVAPTLHFVSITTPVEAGQPAALSGFFSDPGILDTFTLEVDWGDGSPPEIFPYPAGSTSFGANHSYAFGGVRVIELALRDDDQGSAFDVLEVEVPGDPPPAAVPTLGRAAAGVLVALLLLAAARHRRAA
ncbi:MAG: PKD domain-containing protein, partial [Gammaproteobacteria bacterium]|nr:PKD domain-containing protein [Gammaproteobacteria bacterium]